MEERGGFVGVRLEGDVKGCLGGFNYGRGLDRSRAKRGRSWEGVG